MRALRPSARLRTAAESTESKYPSAMRDRLGEHTRARPCRVRGAITHKSKGRAHGWVHAHAHTCAHCGKGTHARCSAQRAVRSEHEVDRLQRGRRKRLVPALRSRWGGLSGMARAEVYYGTLHVAGPCWSAQSTSAAAAGQPAAARAQRSPPPPTPHCAPLPQGSLALQATPRSQAVHRTACDTHCSLRAESALPRALPAISCTALHNVAYSAFPFTAAHSRCV